MSEKPKVMDISELFIQDDEDDEIIKNKNAEPTELNISQLVPFRNHPFKLYEGDRLDDMVESIREYGVILPLIVRPGEDGSYEILSGHNRANSAKIAGLETVPVVIKEGLTDEEAMLIVTETNLIQRSFIDLSFSERARVLAEHYNAIKQQGKRTDLINEIEKLSKDDDLEENSTLSQLETKSRSDDKVGEKYDLSRATVARYLRIDILIEELKDRLDNNEIPLTASVDLSFLKEDEQETVENILETYGFKVDIKKAEILKNFSQGRTFTHDKAYEVLSGKFFNKPKKVKSFKIKPKIISKYFSENQKQGEIEETIEKALEMYFSQNREIDELEEDVEV